MTTKHHQDSSLHIEAEAFNARLAERKANKFVPDIQKCTDNDFFYKSFWRRSKYVDLYFGVMASSYIDYFRKSLKPGACILDFGCGPGYFSLELARAGFTVLGYDIADGCIASAKEYLLSLNDPNLSSRLDYVDNIEDIQVSSFDGILCSGVLHHLQDPQAVVENLLKYYRTSEEACLLFHEPYHTSWTKQDAFVVSTIRLLLSATGNWYEDLSADSLSEFDDYVSGVMNEYVFERDPSEVGGQSPNDLSCDFPRIVEVLNKFFSRVNTWPSRAFIYRCMGGVRANPHLENTIAQLLEKIDLYGVENNFLRPNYMYGSAQGLKAH